MAQRIILHGGLFNTGLARHLSINILLRSNPAWTSAKLQLDDYQLTLDDASKNYMIELERHTEHTVALSVNNKILYQRPWLVSGSNLNPDLCYHLQLQLDTQPVGLPLVSYLRTYIQPRVPRSALPA